MGLRPLTFYFTIIIENPQKICLNIVLLMLRGINEKSTLGRKI